MNSPELQKKAFLLLLTIVSIAFGWIVWPFFGAVFWGSVLAILFTPLYRRLLVVTRGRKNLTALATLILCLVIVILPLTFITTSLVQEGVSLYQKLQSGELHFGTYFQQIINALPRWVVELLDRSGFGNVSALQDKISVGVMEGSKYIATQAFTIGQNTFDFIISFGIMLYLLFFLLREGSSLSERIKQAIPLSMEHKRHLLSKFITVIRATVKGNIVVAAVQGGLGGLIFWVLDIQGSLLWGVLMAFLSLLPMGAAIIWAPVAIYFLFTGEIWNGVILLAFGMLVIGLIDNILRPVLVGKDTQMPDYVVLISTLGGMALFGLNGFIIGPVIAAMFITVWDLFSLSKEAANE
ncbi:AI-2E family transporter [Candidatus Nitrotoga sp. HW29]|uniref:AI-2E family transporter n=1 Tax=Candidatus Nitrotoga sp. HW29 TaxID=2886963 RepID=UPI001EF25F88|nr:AI-2E family transporter [Candidatus Nitrotoga sp. HW29]CAH1906161.1 AI-2E family transporter [Candidatus Nitrotoga sp. HW29]